ncbi:MAG: adenylate/guanylate cyclase domain-containing protein [Chloroflexota bacterium]
MADFSRQETADRAGVPLDEVSQLVELGILAPAEGDRFTVGDVRRIAVVKTLQHGGMPVDGLAALMRSRDASLDFLDSPMYARFSALSSVTFRELSNETGVPVDLLMVIREAVGSATPQPDDLVREDELEVVPFLEVHMAQGMNPHATERLLRVMGDSLRRVAEQQADWWQSEVALPLFQKGAKGGELGDLTREFGEDVNPKYQRAFEAIQHAQEGRTWTANILTGIEMAMTQAGLYTRQDHPPAMCFFDITGYTRLTQERGDEAAAALATTFSRMVQRTSSQYAGRAVKWLGDGVMFYFTDPGPGVVAALEMLEGAADAGLPPAHVGLHAGPVLFQEGDYFGQTVNLAARIAEYARPGEVLVSQAVVDAAEGTPTSFTEIGPVELKGVTEATRLHVARRG